MKSSDLAEFVRLLRREGVAEYSGPEPDHDLSCLPNWPVIHLTLGPLPPAPPKPAEAERPVPREPMPPELAKFVTPELAAELTAILED